MTTIAACLRRGLMCSDSYWTDGESCGETRKVWRIRRELVGLAGGMKEAREWRAAYSKGATLKLPDLTALRLTSSALEVWDCVNGWLPAGHSFAIGSGSQAARAVLALGASPALAVRIATGIDANSGGRVRTYRIRRE